MIPVRFTRRAASDIDRQIEWLADRAPTSAVRASETIYGAIDVLSEFPESSPTSGDGVRDLAVRFGRDGFIVRYRYSRGRVTILRVFHARQER